MDIWIYIIVPALLLAYYLKTMLPDAKNKLVLVGMLGGGTFLFYSGIFFDAINPASASILKLTGACLFFTCVAIYTKRSKEKTPDQSNENSE
jgi:tryptophan-rich sensory protein